MFTIPRATMWALLTVVAGASAVLSFDSLRDLALLSGFTRGLAWLLPVVIDAGAAAGCLVWLSTPGDISDLPARPFARSLTIVLLASGVAGNAAVHGLSAYYLAPPWWPSARSHRASWARWCTWRYLLDGPASEWRRPDLTNSTPSPLDLMVSPISRLVWDVGNSPLS